MRRKETVWRRFAVASRAFRRSWQPQTLDEWDTALDRQIDGLPTYSGAKVNENLALNLSAVWCAVLNIAVTVASLPLKLYRHSGNSRQPYPTHSLYGVLQSRPNTEMDAFIFREIMQRHLLLWGNAYAEIRRNPQTDRVLELWPLNPARMEVHRKNGKIIYIMKTPAGKDDDVFSAKQIFHLKGPGYDGRVGYSVVSQMAKQSMGIALASDMHAGRVFDNFATPRGVLKTGQKFHDREKATKNIRESWQQVYGGPQNTGKVAILEEGMEFEALSMSPEDLQLLATRTFNVQEIARWFNIPVMKLQEHSHSTYSNVSEQYLINC
jgi:HK97 family phage portal protein